MCQSRIHQILFAHRLTQPKLHPKPPVSADTINPLKVSLFNPLISPPNASSLRATSHLPDPGTRANVPLPSPGPLPRLSGHPRTLHLPSARCPPRVLTALPSPAPRLAPRPRRLPLTLVSRRGPIAPLPAGS